MKQFTIFILTIILTGCMGQDEKSIKDFLNSKLTAQASKADKVKILNEDTILSLAPMDVMYNECLKDPGNHEKITKLNRYFLDAVEIRFAVQQGNEKNQAILKNHEFELRRIAKVEVTAEDGHISDNIEVIFDVDNKTPYMVGNEYNIDLNLWEVKVSYVRGY